MFDVGFSELLLLAVVALVVLGPEKLPHAARMTGAWIGRIRRMVLGIQAEIEKEVAAQEMRDRIQKEIERLKSTEVAVNQQVSAVENTIRQTVEEAAALPPDTPAATVEPAPHTEIAAPEAASAVPPETTHEHRPAP